MMLEGHLFCALSCCSGRLILLSNIILLHILSSLYSWLLSILLNFLILVVLSIVMVVLNRLWLLNPLDASPLLDRTWPSDDIRVCVFEIVNDQLWFSVEEVVLLSSMGRLWTSFVILEHTIWSGLWAIF
jgi:hypothetical protein